MTVVGSAEVLIKPLTTNFSADLESKLSPALSKAQGLGKKFGGALGIGLATAAAGGIVAVGIEILHLTDTFEVSHARLETAVHNVGQSFDRWSGQVAGTDKKMESLGFTNADTEASLATLTGVTKNVQTAMGLEGLAADIARGRHIDLSTATGILTKVETGHVALLGRLGIATKDSTGATISSEEAIRRLTTLYGGQAAAYTDTFAGKITVLKTKAEDLGVRIGLAVIPVVETLISDTISVIDFFGKVNAATDGWAGKLVILGAGLTVATIAVGRLETVAAGIPLIGGALAALAAPAAIATGAFLGLHAVISHFAGEQGDSAAATAALADGLKQLGKDGTESYLVFTRFGDNFEKLVTAFHKESGFTGGISNDIASFGEHLLGAATDAEIAARPIKDTQKALLELFKTDPTDAIAAFAKIKQALLDQGVPLKDVDRGFAQYEKTAGAVGEALAPLTAAQQQQVEVTKAQQQAAKDLVTSLDKYGAEAGPIGEKVAKGLRLGKDEVDRLTESTKKMNDGIDKAFNDSGTVIDAWSSKSKFDLGRFEADLLSDTIAAANWSNNIKILARAGIDQGFLQTLIDAGPKSAKVVQGLVDGVSKGSVQTINAIEAAAQKAAGSAKEVVDPTLLGIKASFAEFIAWVNNAHPNLDVRIAGQSATPAQIHSLALAQHGVVGLKLAKGGIATGPTSGYPATLHGTEAILPLNDPRRALQVLGSASRYLGTGGTATASTSSGGGGVSIVLAPVFPPGMDHAAAMAELKTWTTEKLVETLEAVQAGRVVRTGAGR